MPIKQLFAVLSVFVFGISFASQAYAAVAWTTNNAPRERTYVKDSVRKNLGQIPHRNARPFYEVHYL